MVEVVHTVEEDPPRPGDRRLHVMRLPVLPGETIDVKFPEDHEIVGYEVNAEQPKLAGPNGRQLPPVFIPIALVVADRSLGDTETRRFYLAAPGMDVPDGAEQLKSLAMPWAGQVVPMVLFELPID